LFNYLKLCAFVPPEFIEKVKEKFTTNNTVPGAPFSLKASRLIHLFNPSCAPRYANYFIYILTDAKISANTNRRIGKYFENSYESQIKKIL